MFQSQMLYLNDMFQNITLADDIEFKYSTNSPTMLIFYMTVGGNVETEVTLKLTYNDNPRTAGTAITKIIVPNTDGPDLILEREKSGDTFKTKGSVSAKGVFPRSEEGYGPIELFGNDGGSKLVKKNTAYGPEGNKYRIINFFDTHGTLYIYIKQNIFT